MNRRTPFDEFERTFDQIRRAMFGPVRGAGRPAFPVEDDPESAGEDRRPVPFRTWGFPAAEEGFPAPWMGENVNLTLERADDGYVAVADLPGFESDEIDLRIDDGVLTLTAQRDERRVEEGVQRRWRRDVFERVRLPPAVRTDEISASYHNGVLEVDLPADEGDDGTRIEIE